uniref:Tetraspanin 9b n=1 Tax=Acanthochromis polyacanthus TaxID=80966 RepID=A0A3Q1GQ68_9TELE
LILFFVYTDKVNENARRDLKEGLVLYNTDNNAGLRDAWNTIQGEWRCCGVMNHNDWYVALHENVVPDRCCQQVFPGCGRNASNAFWTRYSGPSPYRGSFFTISLYRRFSPYHRFVLVFLYIYYCGERL